MQQTAHHQIFDGADTLPTPDQRTRVEHLGVNKLYGSMPTHRGLAGEVELGFKSQRLRKAASDDPGQVAVIADSSIRMTSCGESRSRRMVSGSPGLHTAEQMLFASKVLPRWLTSALPFIGMCTAT